MRVIEPTQHRKSKPKAKKAKKSYLRPFVLISLLLVIAFMFQSLATNYRDTALNKVNQTGALATAVTASPGQVAGVTDLSLKFFTGEQFQQLYETIIFPNTMPIEQTSKITGDEKADSRIRTIAESRGYIERSIPKLPIVKTNTPDLGNDDLLQPKAYSAWQQIRKDAKNANIPLVLNSGYRSIEAQRELFLNRLNSTGVTASQIASGEADSAVVSVLSQTAPPGYSRHHTGYTVDLGCNDGTGQSFKSTVCYQWLKKDNYKKAKNVGFVPSYPEGVDDQGPEPEPWEYVWVGLSSLVE